MASGLAFNLFLLLFFGLSFAQDPLHIPLTRRSRLPNTFNPAEEANRLRLKYGFGDEETPVRRGRRGTRRAPPVGVPIINQNMDVGYLGEITVGTPPQMFNVILDTGSSDLWLAATSCAGCLPSTPRYVPSQSSSFQGTGQQGNVSLGQNVSIAYNQGTVEGVSVADTVTMGGLKVASQAFVSVSQASNILDGSSSGLIGLAFIPLAQTNATPFWEALVNSNQLSSPEMSFWLTRSTNVQDIEVLGGVFTLGGTNSSLFTGDIEFHNITVSRNLGPVFWLLSVSAVSVGGQSIKISKGTDALAVIDTGTTLIGGPTADVKAIWEAVPGAAPSRKFTGFFEFPCTTVLNISFSFGGTLWPIDSQDMNLGRVSQGSSQCIGAIFDSNTLYNIPENSLSWIIGDTFLKNVYSVFRASPLSVGFAQLSNLTTASANSTASATSTVSTTSTTPTASSSDKLNGSGPINSSTILALLVSGLLSSITVLVL